ncbi:hypothetical protein E2320_022126 [Naja naja]|nr:hypothetical protein E2320_022126 [Naja naja]
MLTSQTVLAIFDRFAEVRLKLDAVIKLIAAVQMEKTQVISTGCQTERTGQIPPMVQTREGVSRQHFGGNRRRKKGGELVGTEILQYRCVGGNRRLLKEQIVLNIYNSETNVGRWTSKRQIVTSLSQLTWSDKGAIDLAAYEYLPQHDNYSRILLKFKQQLFPSLLMQMRGFLAFYQILPSQVFASSEVSPLIQRVPKERGAVLGTADSKSKSNKGSKLIESGGRSSITKEMSAEVLEPANEKLSSIGLMQDETFDSACVETFSLLSLMEQQELGVDFKFSHEDSIDYPSFFRVNPSEYPQYMGLVQLLLHFQWNWVGLLAPEDDNGEHFISSLMPMLKEKEICLAFSEKLKSDIFATTQSKLLHVFKTWSKAEVIILFGDSSSSANVQVAMYGHEVMRNTPFQKVWILTSHWKLNVVGSKNILQLIKPFHGALHFRHHTGDVSNFNHFLLSLDPWNPQGDIFLSPWYQ